MTDLGQCMDGFCTRDAAVYVVGPTLGTSPRITVIAGPRAAELAASSTGALNLRCEECAMFEVERVVREMTPHSPARTDVQT